MPKIHADGRVTSVAPAEPAPSVSLLLSPPEPIELDAEALLRPLFADDIDVPDEPDDDDDDDDERDDDDDEGGGRSSVGSSSKAFSRKRASSATKR
jgi:hypothetical protein